MKGVERTALPLVTHLRVFHCLCANPEEGWRVDFSAASQHMPRLQHLTYEFELEDSQAACRTDWAFVVPTFPCTLLMPLQAVENRSLCQPLKLVVAKPSAGQQGEANFESLEGTGLYAWHNIEFYHGDSFTIAPVVRPVLHLPGLDRPDACTVKVCSNPTADGHLL